MDKIHAIARAYIRDQEFILLADTGKHLFLPGGHINYQESIYKALTRELNEEMYINYLRITNFIGLIENMWDNQGEKFHESQFPSKWHV